MRWFVVGVFFCFTVGVFAQSGRVAPGSSPPTSTAGSDQTVKQMFDNANTYTKAKFTEFEQKKLPYNEALRVRTRQEQKQLAANLAAAASLRNDLAGEDLYYLGMLHWIAENLDGAAESLRVYVADPKAVPEKLQSSRSIIAVIAAKKSDTAEAEKQLAEYIRSAPIRLNEQSRMEGELAKAYFAARNYEKAAIHGTEAYLLSKKMIADPSAVSRLIDQVLDDGMLLFESYRDGGKQEQADQTLDDLRKTAASLQSPSMYYYALDNAIKYQIQSGRKPLGMATFVLSIERLTRELTSPAAQKEVLQKLRRREKQYNMLGEAAPDLIGIDKALPGDMRPLSELKGKVVLLDFWATWCAPCYEAFPSLIEWDRDYREQGLVILGITRYYGRADGLPVDNPNELEFLGRFKKSKNLPYDFLVAKDNSTQRDWGATALPTAVIIDKKGVVRYIESGTNPTRLDEMREMIVKLLAEK